jgi:hypothetical protein
VDAAEWRSRDGRFAALLLFAPRHCQLAFEHPSQPNEFIGTEGEERKKPTERGESSGEPTDREEERREARVEAGGMEGGAWDRIEWERIGLG